MQLFYKIFFKLEKLINKERNRLLKVRLKQCGNNVRIDKNCHILVPERMEIGDNTSISSFTTIYATFGVKIGKNCLISSNCGISSYNHIQHSLNRPDDKDKDVQFSKPVDIGDNVWIGMNSCILPGVQIGNNSIIGSGSVVTKNVPSNEIWVGNPARFIKKLDL
ncbi:acyltransferase [Spirosoma sp. KNUC1025]|uniref:acyltransferase n=1 Tax=Spirosoma sp. KNUC1025 TaxID=2894082 RepID=UPI003863EE1D|nr:acyltransferase [Spirosoma sp. KNUC1025]